MAPDAGVADDGADVQSLERILAVDIGERTPESEGSVGEWLGEGGSGLVSPLWPLLLRLMSVSRGDLPVKLECE